LRERIAIEIQTNFVDLRIFGCEPLARAYANHFESKSARRLLELSELLTYSSLMGMGGTPNHGLKSIQAITATQEAPLNVNVGRPIGPEAKVLTDGMRLGVPDLSGADIIQFHGDGMSRVLWKALEQLEREVADASPATLDDVAEASAAHGALGLDWVQSTLAGIQGAGGLWALRVFDKATRELEWLVANEVTGRRAGRRAVQLWWLDEWRRSLNGIQRREMT
jgi:hypothetical protein